MIEPNMRYYWLKEYSGFIDGIHQIEMVLVTDNKEFRGIYKYNSSGEEFQLFGDARQGQIYLNEYDEYNRVSGVILGIISDDYFYGEWKNRLYTESLPILLKAVDRSHLDCAGSFNYEKYELKIDKDPVSITWIKDKSEFELWIGNAGQNVQQEIECNFLDCQGASVLINDKNLTILPDPTGLKFFLQESKINKSIKPLKSWTVGYQCTEYIDFDERLAEVIPTGLHRSFNKYLQTLMHDKTEFINERIKKAKIENEHCALEDRLANGSFSEAIVSFYNGKIISGLIKIHCSYFTEFTEIPFAYDLTNEREFEITDFFIDSETALKYLSDQYQQHLYENYSEEYIDWCTQSGISGFYISEKGLHLRTKSSPIFGNCETIIPLHQLKADRLINTVFAKILNLK